MPRAPIETPTAINARRFEFERDSFSFANELVWDYRVDAVSGRTVIARRDPQPAYTHRCFVLTRAARQFLLHSTFEPKKPRLEDKDYRRLVRSVLSRSPRYPSESKDTICLPGYGSLRQFSSDHESLLKTQCGGAWRSYVLRSHWRMVFPITRTHQSNTAAYLRATITTRGSAVVHLVCFPKLSINHGMVLYSVDETDEGLTFSAYDPNAPQAPVNLGFKLSSRTFHLPPNSYWAGGDLNVIEIYRNWLF